MNNNHYIFVDYENVRPNVSELTKILSLNINQNQISIFIFYNENLIKRINNLRKVIYNLATSCQNKNYLNINYEIIENFGRNAFNLVILFHIGYLLAKNPNSFFYVISSNKGFDARIAFAQEKNIFIQRYDSISEFKIINYSNNIYTRSSIIKLIKKPQRELKTTETLSNYFNFINRIHYILVDYENIQPKSLELIKILNLSRKSDRISVFIFYNQNQIKYINKFKEIIKYPNINYEVIENCQKDTLDCLIWLKIGYLQGRYPNPFFYIISKDKGFDAGIAFSKEKNIFIERYNSIEEILFTFKSNFKISDYQNNIISYTELYISKLMKQYTTKPKTEQSLLNHIKFMFKDKANDNELQQILEILYNLKFIKNENGKIIYHLQQI